MMNERRLHLEELASAWTHGLGAVASAGGGAMLVAIGVLLVSGLWEDLTVAMQVWVNGFTPAV
mgnify:CR=1 FL=1